MQNIIIDEEFRSLLPALDKEIYAQLEENLIQNGCRDSLILWDGALIDGHNRYEICRKHDIPFNTINKDFTSREEALIWIISNQISRRNLTPIQLSHYRGVHYKADKMIITNADGKNQFSEVGGQNDHQPPDDKTEKRLAGRYRVSPKTIRRDAKVAQAIDAIGEVSPDIKRKILSGDILIHKRDLEDIASKPKEEMATIAAQIEAGEYEMRKQATPAPADEEDDDEAISDDTQALHAIKDKIANILSTGLWQLSKSDGLEELKMTLQCFIVKLERLLEHL